MNHKVITIALIVFALIFIVLLAVMMGTITEKTNTANAQLVDTLSMTEGGDFTQLDGRTVKGNYVISTIDNGKTSGGNQKVAYMVKTRASADYVNYGYGDAAGDAVTITSASAGSTGITEVTLGTDYVGYTNTDASSADYINETDVFTLNVLKNNNDIVVGVAFTQN